MADILTIVSKAVFEKDARVGGKVIGIGDVWPVDRYKSTHKSFDALKGGGHIFLVTVRAPDEQLWLVGVIDATKLTGGAWVSAKPNATPVTNITALRKTITFESGKGMSQDKGALGMSLQTPRALAPSDVTQILAAIGTPTTTAAGPLAVPAASPKTPHAALLAEVSNKPHDEMRRERALRELITAGAFAEAREALQGLAHLDAHDETGLPCLCKRCWEASPETTELGGVTFKRDLVVKSGRVLFFWAPIELESKPAGLRAAVRVALVTRLNQLAKQRSRQRYTRPAF